MVAAYPPVELLICVYVMSMVVAVKGEERIRPAVVRYQFVSETRRNHFLMNKT